MNDSPLLSVRDLNVTFHTQKESVNAVKNVSFDLGRNEVLGIVGESGSGKSVTALSIMNLIMPSGKKVDVSGSLHMVDLHDDINLYTLKNKEWDGIRGKMLGMVFQEPSMSLNPSKQVGDQVAEAIRIHQSGDKNQIKAKVLDLFNETGLDDQERIYTSYPHQLSGGQLQRIMISIAISNRPAVFIADEPTTALDVTIQKNILNLIKSLQSKYNMSTLFISHDLGVIREVAHRVLVMKDGEIVESGLVEDVFNHPVHPYTKGILYCRPPVKRRCRRLPELAGFLASAEDKTGLKLEDYVESTETYEKRLQLLKQSPDILNIKNVSRHYIKKDSFGLKKKETFIVLDGVSLQVRKGEILGLVGESGSGKTTLAQCIAGLQQVDKGEILFNGKRIESLYHSTHIKTKEIQMIFQDPYSSLNPRMTVGEAITEPMEHLELKSERWQKAALLMEKVGLNPSQLKRYPHEFSGGQRQRICIARALAADPVFLICDECVSALDVTTQAQILNLLKKLRDEMNLSMLFISHDLSVIRFMSDYVAVIKNGKIVEFNDSEKLFMQPSHAYSRLLVESIPGSGNL